MAFKEIIFNFQFDLILQMSLHKASNEKLQPDTG